MRQIKLVQMACKGNERRGKADVGGTLTLSSRLSLTDVSQ